MPQIEEGFKITLNGNADSLEAAGAQAAASIGNVLKAAAKVSQLDSFKSLSQSASKAVTNINAITGDLQKIRIDYTLPNFAPLQRLILSVKGDMNKAFLSVIPQPDTNPFTRAIAAMVTSAERNLETLRNTRVNMGAVQPPDLTLLKKAVDVARNELSKTALVSFPPPPKVDPIVIPAADTTRFTQSIRTVQTTAERVNTLLHSFESVKVPAIQPPSLTALENVVRDARANIDKTFLAPIPTQPFVNLSKEVQGIITGLKAQNIQVPFAIQQPDLSNIRAGVEHAKKSIQDSLNIKIPAPTVQPIPAPKTTGYTTAVQGAIKLINELNSAAGSVATAVKPPDLTGYKAAITAVRNDLQNASLVKVPPVDAKDFNASITPLQRAMNQVDKTFQLLSGTSVQIPTVLPPNLQPLKSAIRAAKQDIESVGLFRMPAIEMPKVPALDYRAFDASANVISTKVQQVNKLFTAVSDTPINAPALVPFDTKPLQKAVDVSKKLLSETAGLALPFIETPDVKPLNTAPYLNSLTTLQQSTLAAQKVITGISTIDVPAPVIQPPSLAPLFNAVATAKKTLSGIELELPKVSVQPIQAIAAPKIDTAPFDTSANALQAKIRDLNGLFKSVDATDIPAPTLLPLDTHPLLKAVAAVKEQIAAVKFAEIKMPTIQPVEVPPVDASLFDRSVSLLQRAVSQVGVLLSAASFEPIQAPAVIPPDLQPLRSAIAKAKANIESVRLISLPQLVMPDVPALDSRVFDTSVTEIRTKIQNVNRLFTTVSDTPINAPALIPFDVLPLQNAVAQAKREINTAANLKLPTLAVPKIPGLNTSEFEKSVGLLQKRVELANTYLTDYGKTVIPTPVLPTPNLQPLFNAIATAKQNIERSGTIKLPAVDMPSLARVVVPPVETAAFDASVNNVRARLDAVNNAFKGVSLQPIVPPAIQPPDTKPLYNAVDDIKKQIASVRFATIQFPTIERVTVPPVEHGTFDRSIVSVAAQVAQFNTLLTQSKATPFVIPTPIPPDETPVRKFVSDIKAQIESLTKLPTATIEGLQLQPLDLRPFDNSVTALKASIVGVHNILHSISAEPIVPPAIRPPDLSALRDAISKVRMDIANAANIRLPRIETPVIPAIDQKQFNTSYVDVRTRIASLNTLFGSIDNTPIAAPLVAAPNFSDILSAVTKAKAGINNTFLEPIPLTSFTNASTQILGVFKSLNDQKLNVPFAMPATQDIINQVRTAKDNLVKIWTAPVLAPKFTPPNIPPMPPVPPLLLPPLDTFDYMASLKEAIAQVRADAAKGFTFELISDSPNMVLNLDKIISKIQSQKIEIPFTVENVDANKVTGQLKQIKDEVEDINDTPVKVETGGSFQSIAALENELKDLRESLRNATSLGDIAKFNNAISVTQGRINQLQSIRDPFQKFKLTLGGAQNSVLNFGRVVQDLPFAFQNFGAIANNIDPLFESFSRLKAEAKATGVSLTSSLLGALTGPAGIGLAISAVTSLVTAFSIGLFNNKESVKDDTAVLDAMNARLKETKEAFDSVLESIDLLNRLGGINIDIFGQTKVLDLQGQSVSNLQAIQESLRKEAQYMKEVRTAQNDLNAQQQVDFFGNDIEPAKQYVDALNAANQALLGQQKETKKLQGDQSVLYRLIAKQREDDKKASADFLDQFRPEHNFFDKYLEFNPSKLGMRVKQINDIIREGTKLGIPKDQINNVIGIANTKEVRKQMQELLDAAIAFRKEFGSGTGLRVAIPDFEIMQKGKALDTARTFWKEFQKGIVKFKPPVLTVDYSIVPRIDPDENSAEKLLESERQGFQKNVKPINIPFGIVPKLNAKSAEIKNFTELGKQVGGTLGQAGGDAFALIFQKAINNASIGAAALTNVAASIKENFTAGAQLSAQFFSGIVQGAGAFTQALIDGQSGIQAFGDVMQQTLKKMIIQLAEAAALAAILSAITGGTAGGGLSFLGQFRKILGGGGIPGLASGGIVPNSSKFSGDRFGPVMLNAGEAVIPLNKLSQYVNTQPQSVNVSVSGQLRGKDIRLQQARVIRSQGRIG